MTDDRSDERDAFFAMAREFPLRTCIFTFGLPAFALLQLINGLFYEGVFAYVALLAVVAIALSVQVTRYQMAVYERERVTDAILREE
jgi:hypothetical protein